MLISLFCFLDFFLFFRRYSDKVCNSDVRCAASSGKLSSLPSPSVPQTAFAKTGDPFTMSVTKDIEILAMTNAKVPLDYATNAVDKAISVLAKARVTQPLRIPWN